MLHDIRRWYAYARWANGRMLDACETLTNEALTRDVGTSFGSLVGTLEHLHGADWVWLERFLGRNPTSWPAKGSLTTMPAFRVAFDALESERQHFLETLGESRLAEPLSYRNLKGEAFTFPLGELLFHVSNHATYHRGQVMQLVRQFGGVVQSTDYLYWIPTDP
jgi:uncharacterized damage-inducible protein DinB